MGTGPASAAQNAAHISGGGIGTSPCQVAPASLDTSKMVDPSGTTTSRASSPEGNFTGPASTLKDEGEGMRGFCIGRPVSATR
jgi:hypothetical protein